MFQFIKESYGEDIIIRFLLDPDTSFGEKIKNILKIDFNTFSDKLNSWKNQKTGNIK